VRLSRPSLSLTKNQIRIENGCLRDLHPKQRASRRAAPGKGALTVWKNIDEPEEGKEYGENAAIFFALACSCFPRASESKFAEKIHTVYLLW
jgi:hypothetical protein